MKIRFAVTLEVLGLLAYNNTRNVGTLNFQLSHAISMMTLKRLAKLVITSSLKYDQNQP